jgi:hypothetical protein
VAGQHAPVQARHWRLEEAVVVVDVVVGGTRGLLGPERAAGQVRVLEGLRGDLLHQVLGHGERRRLLPLAGFLGREAREQAHQRRDGDAQHDDGGDGLDQRHSGAASARCERLEQPHVTSPG